jgi:hypothetical protein
MPQTYHAGLEATVTVGGTDVNAHDVNENQEVTASDITNSSHYDAVTGMTYTADMAVKAANSGTFRVGFDTNNRVDLLLYGGVVVAMVLTKSRGGTPVTTSGNALITGVNYTSGGRDGHGELECSYRYQGKPTRT